MRLHALPGVDKPSRRLRSTPALLQTGDDIVLGILRLASYLRARAVPAWVKGPARAFTADGLIAAEFYCQGKTSS